MAICDSDELRRFATRLDSLAQNTDDRVGALLGTRLPEAEGWRSERNSALLAQLAKIAAPLGDSTDDWREFAVNLRKKAKVVDKTRAHRAV